MEKLTELTTDQKWKKARIGVIIFCVIHFFFEILTGNTTSAALPVVVNYFISAWWIKDKYLTKEKPIKSYILTGLTVAGVVFLIRVLLGVIFFSLV